MQNNNKNIPTFFRDNNKSPNTWLTLTENILHLNNTFNEKNICKHIITALLQDILPDIADELHDIHKSTTPLQTLKNILNKQYKTNKQTILHELFNTHHDNSTTPSKILKQIQNKLKLISPDNTSDDNLIRELFMKHLPPDTAKITTTLQDQNIENIAHIADLIHEQNSNSQRSQQISDTQPQTTTNETLLQTLITTIQENTQILKNISIDQQKLLNTKTIQHTRSSSPHTLPKRPYTNNNYTHKQNKPNSSPRYNYNHTSPTTHHRHPSPNKYCYYHNRFGSRALKCESPCQFPSKN